MDEPSVSPHRVTQLLAEWSNGDSAASFAGANRRLIYEELQRLAHHFMEGQGVRTHTLQQPRRWSTRLILRLGRSNQSKLARAGLISFFAVAARAMRQILVSYARK